MTADIPKLLAELRAALERFDQRPDPVSFTTGHAIQAARRLAEAIPSGAIPKPVRQGARATAMATWENLGPAGLTKRQEEQAQYAIGMALANAMDHIERER